MTPTLYLVHVPSMTAVEQTITTDKSEAMEVMLDHLNDDKPAIFYDVADDVPRRDITDDVIEKLAWRYEGEHPDAFPEWAEGTAAHIHAEDENYQARAFGTYAQQHSDDYRKAVL
jgi:hypothetical protein